MMRKAFTAVVHEGHFRVDRADENIKGYVPIPWTRRETYEEAQELANNMNKNLGLTPKEAIGIVLTTMG